MGQYLPIVALTVLAILFAVISLLASKLLAPNRPNSAKEAPYECGIVPSREPPERFPVSFFVVAMLFIMFDIEIIFAYPYAVEREFLGVYGFLEMVSFSAVFFVGLRVVPLIGVQSSAQGSLRLKSHLVSLQLVLCELLVLKAELPNGCCPKHR
jgi:NADH-quinone oxidoreductase subunit A